MIQLMLKRETLRTGIEKYPLLVGLANSREIFLGRTRPLHQ